MLVLFFCCLFGNTSGRHHSRECKPPPKILHRSTNLSQNTVSFSCDTGFRLNGAYSLHCRENGQWSDHLPTCEILICPNPGVVNDGHFVVESSALCRTQNLDQLHYECSVRQVCNAGYTLDSCTAKNQPERRKCLASGHWSHSNCLCERIKCQYPGDIKNGQYKFPNGSIYSKGILNYGEKIFVNCLRGYELFGNDSRLCISTNIWSGETSVCSIIKCTYPGHYPNGFYTTQNGSNYSIKAVEYGSVILVHCFIGYENLGDKNRTCMGDKSFSGKSPVCNKINCSHPGSFQNGVYTLPNGSIFMSKEAEYETKLVVKCNVGYENRANDHRTCSSNKNWSGQTPVCSIIACSHPGSGAIENGHYRKEHGDLYINGSENYLNTIKVICILGYNFLSGSRNRTCLADRTWSGNGATCTKVKCPVPNATAGVIYYPSSVKELLFGDTLNVSCEEGFLINGSKVRRCAEDGNVDGDIAVCEKTEMQASSHITLIAAATSVGSFIITAIAVILFVLKCRKRQCEEKQNNAEIPTHNSDEMKHLKGNVEYAEIQETASIDAGNGRTEDEIVDGVYTNTSVNQSEQVYYSFDGASVTPKTAIFVKDLPHLVLKGKAATQKFSTEFEGFAKGLKEKHSQALELQNRGKNKYKNLYAYDQTRVILEKERKDDSDYINASYIHGFNKVKAYIASQGPVHVTLEDFWKMIWQTKSSNIVMLTNLIEEGRKKCEQYWPDTGSLTYGNITVTLKKEEHFSEFAIRHLLMKKGQNVEENVTHFHFTAWPDKGVPKYASSLVKFRSKVKNAPVYRKGPTVIHCSAGIGRTGTFIALDYLTDQANALSYIDVARTVETLRKQRVNMVQTLEQYIFVHHALVETLMLPTSTSPASKFPDAYKTLLRTDKKSRERQIDLEFKCNKITNIEPRLGKTNIMDIATMQVGSGSMLVAHQCMLKKLSPVTEEIQYVSAKVVRNRQKNRYLDIIPVDDFMPSLTTDDGTHTDYVNAVYLPSYRERKAFIITQTPLETTREDFWRLVWEHNIHTIIMMNNSDEMMDAETYWPKQGAKITFGNIDIVNDGIEVINIHHAMSLTVGRNEKTRNIKQFQFGDWKPSESLPESPESVLSLMEQVQGWQQQTQNHTILVHCMNGVDKSGLFCVISAVIERMKIEQDVAISHVIEEMRNAREQIIPSLEQYQFCHEAVLAFMQQYETYSNFTA